MKTNLYNRGTMRAMVKITVVVQLTFVALMAASIIADIVRATPPDWTGMATFMGGLSVLVIGIGAAKAYQKKHEYNNNNSHQ